MRGRLHAAFLVIGVLLLTAHRNGLFAEQTATRREAHRGAVLALAATPAGDRVLSVGEDGFLDEWNTAGQEAVSRFQLTPYAAQSVSLSRDGQHIAVIETDGLGLYRVSAWSIETHKKLFTLRFKDRVSYLSYSAGGSFLVATRDGKEGVTLLNATSGELISAPTELTGPISFAATGRSERTMIAYAPAGRLSYWDLATGQEIKRIDAPPNLVSPILFGNNRYFAGIDGQGLAVIDAVTGTEISRYAAANGRFLVSPSPESSSLLMVSDDGSTHAVREFTIPDAEQRLIALPSGSIELPSKPSAAIMRGTELFIGLNDGTVSSIDASSGTITAYRTSRRIHITDAAASGDVLLAVSDAGRIALPSNPENFEPDASITPIRGEAEDRVLGLEPPEGDGRKARFILWRSDGTTHPLLYDGVSILPLAVPTGIPFRSASASDDRVLFLDAAGSMTVVSQSNGLPVFSFASIGILDAVLNEGTIIAGKNRGVSPKVPLLAVDDGTGETVPIDIAGAAIVRLYRGRSGALYGIVADTDLQGPKTTIVRLDLSILGSPRVMPIAEYRSEDVEAMIAETGNSVATTLGGDGASLIRPSEVGPFQRSDALPARLTEGSGFYIVVDSDGGICWHDPTKGDVKAVLRIFENRWELESKGKRIGGPVA